MAAAGAIGAGINAVSGIASQQQAKSQGRRAADLADRQNQQIMGALLGDGGENAGLLNNMISGMTGATSGLLDVTAGGSQQLNDLANQLGGINPNFDFSAAPTTGGFQFADAPTTGGYQFSPEFQFSNVNTGQDFNFTTGSNLANQTMDAFRTQEAGVRANALDQMARQNAADVAGMDAALAARGLNRSSGVATGALADLMGNQAAEMAALNRDLATLGSQTALQGAQFDVNRIMQEQQMQSGYNLGSRQLTTDAQLQQQQMQSQYGLSRDQMQSQYGLSQDQLRSQNWAQDQSMRSQYAQNQDQLASQNWLADQQMRSQYGLDQARLQQQGIGLAGDLINAGIGNQLQAGLGIGNLFGGALSPILSSLVGMQNIAGENVRNAGAGAGTAGWVNPLVDSINSGMTNKNNQQPATPPGVSIGGRLGAAVVPSTSSGFLNLAGRTY